MLAAFAFGMWAAIAIYPGYDLGFGWLPGMITIALTGVPLVMVLADVILNAAERHEGIVATACAALAAASSYLGVMLLLLAGLDAVRRVFPWQVQGVQIISGAAPWQPLLAWLLAVALALGALAVAISATGGLVEVTREFATAVPSYQLANIAVAERRLAAGPMRSRRPASRSGSGSCTSAGSSSWSATSASGCCSRSWWPPGGPSAGDCRACWPWRASSAPHWWRCRPAAC